MLYKVCYLYNIMHYSEYDNRDERLQKAAEQFLIALRAGCGILLLVFLLFSFG